MSRKPKTLVFQALGLLAACSCGGFGAHPPVKLAFTVQPTGAFTGVAMRPVAVTVQDDLGNTSARRLSIVRRTESHGLVTILVDLKKASADPRENIIIQPGDFLVLQETTGEAFTRYMNNNFRYNFTYQIIHSPFFNTFITGMGF